MDMVNVKINGIAASVPKGSTILEAARQIGIEIPTLCYMKKINEIGERVRLCNDRRLRQDWLYLQSSDHFYYMNTKHPNTFSLYDNPYDAFNNYMNVLSDFILRVQAQYPSSIENEELNSLLTVIDNQGREIEELQRKLAKYEKKSK